MPPDMVFGVLEREFLKRKEFLTLEEYIEAISKQTIESKLGEDYCL